MPVHDIGQALRALLLADSAVATAVGNIRIFPTVLPQNETRASLVYNRISEVVGLHMKGADWLTSTRIQLDAWAPSRDAAMALANHALLVLHGYRGSIGSPAVPIQQIELQAAGGDQFDSSSKLYGVGRDYMVRYNAVY